MFNTIPSVIHSGLGTSSGRAPFGRTRETPAASPAGASPERTGLGLSDEDLICQLFEWFKGVLFKGSKKTMLQGGKQRTQSMA